MCMHVCVRVCICIYIYIWKNVYMYIYTYSWNRISRCPLRETPTAINKLMHFLFLPHPLGRSSTPALAALLAILTFASI